MGARVEVHSLRTDSSQLGVLVLYYYVTIKFGSTNSTKQHVVIFWVMLLKRDRFHIVYILFVIKLEKFIKKKGISKLSFSTDIKYIQKYNI